MQGTELPSQQPYIISSLDLELQEDLRTKCSCLNFNILSNYWPPLNMQTLMSVLLTMEGVTTTVITPLATLSAAA